MVKTLTIDPFASLGHSGSKGADEKERSLDVDGVDGVDVLVAGLRRRAEGEDTGVVDQDVDLSAAEVDGSRAKVRTDSASPSSAARKSAFPPAARISMDDGVPSGCVSAAHQDVCATVGEQHGVARPMPLVAPVTRRSFLTRSVEVVIGSFALGGRPGTGNSPVWSAPWASIWLNWTV